ncbi:glutamyl-Q tRNA(Asp) synthetase [Geobacter sp. OR-1]|uniref:tRNA glutamyl-Q(34) synthetase GluQRS n=1 Tax=Geobacter sp. OR-1 TaxID=1266765 RepID=UPI0005424E35|nr:tRNA glutamyl-Q(34) synthetase GluQRS [Geobacter sp. OR-1]GAM11075.1 glutamyl-Q tRNA(Asp) synthetase [Geobacter sp. OR-1]
MIVGRFAPSPTGPLHTGSLVAAVGSYLMARRGGGRWLVRMEDLDSPRVVPGCGDDILWTLEALGFAWDGAVVRQSERGELYQEALDRLIALGAAYPCGCSRAEIARVATAPHDGDGEFIYPGTCRNGLPAGKSARGWRVRTTAEPIRFEDLVLGPLVFQLPSLCGDFVVKRSDGLFAYQLAVVVDDALQGVNQVVRGADLLSSTPRQIHLQQLLGYATPEYAHLPLVTGPGGAKLSKRDNVVSSASTGINIKDASRLIFGALAFLGQNPPPDLATAPPAELLGWGVDNFGVAAVRSCRPGPFPVPDNRSFDQ